MTIVRQPGLTISGDEPAKDLHAQYFLRDSNVGCAGDLRAVAQFRKWDMAAIGTTRRGGHNRYNCLWKLFIATLEIGR